MADRRVTRAMTRNLEKECETSAESIDESLVFVSNKLATLALDDEVNLEIQSDEIGDLHRETSLEYIECKLLELKIDIMNSVRSEIKERCSSYEDTITNLNSENSFMREQLRECTNLLNRMAGLLQPSPQCFDESAEKISQERSCKSTSKSDSESLLVQTGQNESNNIINTIERLSHVDCEKQVDDNFKGHLQQLRDVRKLHKQRYLFEKTRARISLKIRLERLANYEEKTERQEIIYHDVTPTELINIYNVNKTVEETSAPESLQEFQHSVVTEH